MSSWNMGLLGAAGAEAGSFVLIQTLTSNGSIFSVDFQNIPQTYKHLQIRYVAKTTDSSNGNLNFEIAPFSAGSFSRHSIFGNTSSVAPGNNFSADFGQIPNGVPISTTTNAFGAGIVDILDYTNTSRSKTLRVFQGQAAVNDRVGLHGIRSGSTNAVTRIIISVSNGNLTSGSRFSLYGIR